MVDFFLGFAMACMATVLLFGAVAISARLMAWASGDGFWPRKDNP